MNSGRRNLLVFAGIVAAIYGGRAVPWERFFGSLPDFVPMDGLPPFRTLETTGAVSTASSALVGVDPPGADAEARHARAETVKARLCSALYRGASPEGVVPIAYFSEVRCPNCRVLERRLDAVLAADPNGVRLVLHELPIFGPPSELAARASVAAANQGLQEPLHRALISAPILPDAASINAIASGLGIDTARLARDMETADVQAQLDETRALADLFGFAGTPGLVIGRTVLTGAIERSLIERIIEDEGKQPPLIC